MTKIGTEVAHVTRDSDTTYKVKRSKVKVTRPLYSPPCWHVRQLLAVRNCWYVAVCWAARGTSAPTGEERGGGISWRPPAYSLLYYYVSNAHTSHTSSTHTHKTVIKR